MTEINIPTNSKNNTVDSDAKTSIYTVAGIFCLSIMIFVYYCVMLVLYGRNPTYLSWLIAFEAVGLIIATRWSLNRHIVLVHCFSDGKELLGWTDVVMPYISLLGSWIPVSILAFINSQKSTLATIYIYTIFASIYTCGIVRLYRFPLQCLPIVSIVAICIGTLVCPLVFMFIPIPTQNDPEPMAISFLGMFMTMFIALFYCVWLCMNYSRKGATSWQRFVEISVV